MGLGSAWKRWLGWLVGGCSLLARCGGSPGSNSGLGTWGSLRQMEVEAGAVKQSQARSRPCQIPGSPEDGPCPGESVPSQEY